MLRAAVSLDQNPNFSLQIPPPFRIEGRIDAVRKIDCFGMVFLPQPVLTPFGNGYVLHRAPHPVSRRSCDPVRASRRIKSNFKILHQIFFLSDLAGLFDELCGIPHRRYRKIQRSLQFLSLGRQHRKMEITLMIPLRLPFQSKEADLRSCFYQHFRMKKCNADASADLHRWKHKGTA